MKKTISLLTILCANGHVSANDELTFEQQKQIFVQYNTLENIHRSNIQDPSQTKYGLIIMQHLKITANEQHFKDFLEQVREENDFLSDLYTKADYILDSFNDSFFWSEQGFLVQFPAIRR
jgi:hypothetical protein